MPTGTVDLPTTTASAARCGSSARNAVSTYDRSAA
ncbi:Uncharacterised protein [Mycobacteroides abscessus]|nr:Uncharacterised protein [Mycobacteroides abscessus]